jgi:hypothetical protein
MRAGCGDEVIGESIRRADYAGNYRLSDVLFRTVGVRGDRDDSQPQ